MGNCLKKESGAEWGGEEWEFLDSKTSKQVSPTSEAESGRTGRHYNKYKKVHFDAHVEVFGGGGYEEELVKGSSREEGMGQVRIRISKKKFEELLGKVEVQSLSAHEMMSLLVNHRAQQDGNNDDQKAWRPVLKTIPEL